MEIKKTLKQTITLVLLITFLLSMHLLDIGQVFGEAAGWESQGCNGLWCLKAVSLYHSGMYGMLICFIALFFITWNNDITA